MINRQSPGIPIRSKLEMLDDIVQIIYYLHVGDRKQAEKFIEDLMVRAMYLETAIQGQVLRFVGQVEFQYNYDPWHKVTIEVQKAADTLIEELGFRPPNQY